MARAKWSVLVDWNNDGDFSDADDDVTSDVLRLTLEQLRDLGSGYMEAARLEVQLRNDDHKYSPSNGSSPLSGDLKPGRKVWLRAAYPFDSFTDAAGTSLASHTPDYDESFSWTEHLQGFHIAPGGVGIQTDGTQGNGDCVATLDFGDPDVAVGCDFTRGSDVTDHGGLCFRYSNSSNYLYVRVTGSAIEVRKVEAGSDSQVASASYTWDTGAGKFLQVALHGDSIRVFVDSVPVIDTVESFNSTATRHGVFCDDEADHTWDRFGGWTSLFYGSVATIHPRPRRDAQYCYLQALDEMERLTSVILYTYATSQFPQTSDEILDDILDYAGVDSSRRKLDAGVQLVPDSWSPAMWHVRALDEIYQLQGEEDGLIYVDGYGCWRLEGRSHRSAGPHAASRATLADASGGADPYFSELVWDDGSAHVENAIFMRIRDATNNGLQTVWTLKEKPHFEANETKDFLAESKDYDVVVGQLNPVEDTDYAANTSQDGSGTDISGELTVALPDPTGLVGKGTLIRVTFGATSGYLTLLKLRSLNALTFADPVLVRAEDADSQSAYGQRVKEIEARWTREVDIAQAAIDSRLARRKDPKTVLNVVVLNGSRPNMLNMLHRAISDRVRVVYSDMGIDQDFFMEGHRLTVSEGGTLVARELLLQAV